MSAPLTFMGYAYPSQSYSHRHRYIQSHAKSYTHLEITSHVPFCIVSCHQMHKKVHTTPCGHPLTLKHKSAAMHPTPLLHHSSLWPVGLRCFPPEATVQKTDTGVNCWVIPELRTQLTSLTTAFSTPHHKCSPGSQADMHSNPDPPLTSCVTWSMLHNLLMPQFPY